MPDLLGGFSYTWPWYACGVLAYLLGSVPFGLLLTRLAGHGDIRKIGSGNIGATNVLRTGSKGLAALTLLLDGLKGWGAVSAGGFFGPDYAAIAAVAVVIGHVFPVWLRFRGGKGVATSLGVLFGLSWPVALLACGIWLLVALLLRYSSLAALVALPTSPFGIAGLLSLQRDGLLPYWLPGQPQDIEVMALIAVLVAIRHHDNVARLVRGTEPRIGRRDSGPTAV